MDIRKTVVSGSFYPDNKEEIKKILRNIKNQEHKSTKTISYKGDRQVHNAYDIDLSLLRFNPYNDRIHTLPSWREAERKV